jgi:hypothetical protein
MTEHGISTSTADYWLHFHPLEPMVYWYAREICLQYIERQKLPIKIGRSKDAERTATGAGYLVPKKTWFIVSQSVQPLYRDRPRWDKMTDREAGLMGAAIIQVEVDRGNIWLPVRRLVPRNSREDQCGGVDFELRFGGNASYEVKVERVLSENLFVQVGESGHVTNCTPDGQRRDTELKGFRE